MAVIRVARRGETRSATVSTPVDRAVGFELLAEGWAETKEKIEKKRNNKGKETREKRKNRGKRKSTLSVRSRTNEREELAFYLCLARARSIFTDRFVFVSRWNLPSRHIVRESKMAAGPDTSATNDTPSAPTAPLVPFVPLSRSQV